MGNFDGVHRGHQHIFRCVQERATHVHGTSVVLTFHPHPHKILFPDTECFLINHLEEKINIIRKIGIDVLVCLPFTNAFAALPPKCFVQQTLVDILHVSEIYIGENSRFGLAQKGTPERLVQWGREYGFRVTVVPPIVHHGIVVSSTKIRQFLHEGQVEMATELLNRPYAIDGEVVSGTHRGTTLLGYPTANIDVQHELIPKRGVYICQVYWNGKFFPAVMNIGTNPTFQQEKTTLVEVHLLDFQADIYGQRISVLFLQRLRDELRFSNYQDLIQQIAQDVSNARSYFHSHPIQDLSA
jgi:riboflavin kinase/FMN adenylyltransferase